MLQRNPGDFYSQDDLEYRKLEEQHDRYEAELLKIEQSEFHSAEDLLEEVRLKKLKLKVKDEMLAFAQRHRLAHPA
ncbi:MAG: hypothetical protein LAN71_07440 [Acidobacteriia bacterium]|nr:hypothetical protein [Terriglobia bacterium]